MSFFISLDKGESALLDYIISLSYETLRFDTLELHDNEYWLRFKKPEIAPIKYYIYLEFYPNLTGTIQKIIEKYFNEVTTESSVKRALVRMEGHYFDKFLGESNEIIMSSEFSLIDIYGLSLGDKSGDWFNEKPKFKIILIP